MRHGSECFGWFLLPRHLIILFREVAVATARKAVPKKSGARKKTASKKTASKKKGSKKTASKKTARKKSASKKSASKKSASKKTASGQSADPCWDGYERIGTKKKAGKTVPNCVPEK